MQSLKYHSFFRRVENPEVYIIGEEHWSRNSTLEQKSIIEELKPEYLLLEALGENQPEDLKGLVENFKQSRMDYLIKKFRLKIDERIIEECKKRFNKMCKRKDPEKCLRFHWIPKNIDDLKKFPIYALHDTVLDVLSERCGILFHQFKSDPEISKLSILLCAAGHAGSKVAGCRSLKITEKMMRNFISVEDAKRGLVEVKQKEFEKAKREMDRYMARKIIEYIKRRKTNRPIVAIVGRAHADKTSALHEVLEREGIKYTVLLDKTADNR